jgi:hypothetical protein
LLYAGGFLNTGPGLLLWLATQTKAEKEADEKKKAKDEARKKQKEEEAAAAARAPDPLALPSLAPNLNRSLASAESATGSDGGAVEVLTASNIDDALAVLAIGSKGDKARPGAAAVIEPLNGGRKAAYAEFEDRQMMVLREENPHLKMAQYKDKIFKLWQRSPENPENQKSLFEKSMTGADK